MPIPLRYPPVCFSTCRSARTRIDILTSYRMFPLAFAMSLPPLPPRCHDVLCSHCIAPSYNLLFYLLLSSNRLGIAIAATFDCRCPSSDPVPRAMRGGIVCARTSGLDPRTCARSDSQVIAAVAEATNDERRTLLVPHLSASKRADKCTVRARRARQPLQSLLLHSQPACGRRYSSPLQLCLRCPIATPRRLDSRRGRFTPRVCSAALLCVTMAFVFNALRGAFGWRGALGSFREALVTPSYWVRCTVCSSSHRLLTGPPVGLASIRQCDRHCFPADPRLPARDGFLQAVAGLARLLLRSALR